MKIVLSHTIVPSRHLPVQQGGFTLISVLFIIMIVTVMATGSMNLGHISQKSSGSAIQRSRAFQAADGGSTIAENDLKSRLTRRLHADSIASEGIFSAGTYTQKWWRDSTFSGDTEVDPDAVVGVAHPPRHIYEEVGQYATDGGTGIVGLDLGSGTYGGRSRGGREVVLYRVESHGAGSLNDIQSVIETVLIHSL